MFVLAVLFGYAVSRWLREMQVPFYNVLAVVTGVVVFHHAPVIYYSRAVTDEFALLGLLLGALVARDG